MDERPTTELELRRHCLDRYGELTNRQRLIADWLLDNLHELPFLSVPKLAQRCGASEATVVRFAQALGFTGHRELKKIAVEVMHSEVTSSSYQPQSESSEHGGASIELEIANLRALIDGLDSEIFDQAATMLREADHVFTFGIGLSARLAELASHLLTENGARASSLTNTSSSPRQQLASLRETDLLWVFSLTPHSQRTTAMIDVAKGHGSATMALCDHPTAPACIAAGLALAVRCDSVLASPSLSACMGLITALISSAR